MNFKGVSDKSLVEKSLSGSKKALEELIRRHQVFVYNLVWKMVLNPQDAEDLTQDIFVKVITKLSQFKQKSKFRTWLYRIAVNYILNCKKQKRELLFTDFEMAENLLDRIPDKELSYTEKIELSETIEDVKISCTAGMLLCLDREQRITFILGAIFKINHKICAEILEISPDNFRKRLSRARKDLYNFMENKCGLVNKNNPCRCPKKTKGFIEKGWAFPEDLQFNSRHVENIFHSVSKKNEQILNLYEEKYDQIFENHPLQKPVTSNRIISEILNDTKIKSVFNLN